MSDNKPEIPNLENLPPEVVLEQFANEVREMASRIEANIVLLSEYHSKMSEEKRLQSLEHVQAFIQALYRTVDMVEDYLQKDDI